MPVMSGLTPRLLRADKHESSADITITCGAGGVFGAWGELVESTGIQVNYINIQIDDAATGNDYVIAIGIGAEGSEVDLIDELHYETDLTGNAKFIESVFFKVEIAKGTRISARCKAVNASDNISIIIQLTGT